MSSACSLYCRIACEIFLLAASYFFYGCWDWRFLGLMLLSTVIDFQCSKRIADSADDDRRKRFLVISVVANLAILGFFKYFNFFAESLQQLAASSGVQLNSTTLDIVLPVGISFYTFQTMSYTIDVYRGDVRRLGSFLDFALYVAFFPQLVAGPIERGSKLAPQIQEGRRTSFCGLRDGTWLVTKGLFKKAVIADNLAPVVSSVFDLSQPTAAQVMIGVYAFAFQIYGDFSGYTDIARGIGRMLGYDLMLNFRLPYFATNPSEFWQRWHISLSSWLRDYLYIPLGGNRGGTLLTYRNLMLTMLLGGLWHGAAWTFVLWGLFHGLLLVAHRSFAICWPWPERAMAFSYPLRVIGMFHLTCLGWLIFRANSVGHVVTMLKSLTVADFHLSLADQQAAWKLLLLCGPLLLIQAGQQFTGNLNFVPSLSVLPRAAIYTATVMAILTIGTFGQQQFIYFQF
ncbi:MAG: MBOAT family O-acyltransferase [Planctomycetaceae bacterium]